MAESVHDANNNEIATINVIVQTASRQPPGPDDCVQWRDAKGHEDVITLYDDTGVLAPFWETNYTNLSVFISGGWEITGKLHTENEPQINAQLTNALNK